MPISNANTERFQLLSTFKAVYDTGGISSAAISLGISQSAASKHLQKLRDWFNDELFVRTINGMVPTAKSVSLITRVEVILSEIDLLTQQSIFDPALLEGTFTIATTSELNQHLAKELLQILRRESPKVRLTMLNLASDYSYRELETGKVDVTISVNWHAPEQLIQKRLLEDHFVCLMRKTHQLANRKLSLRNYAEASHIMVAPLGHQRGYIDGILLERGFKRHVRLSVPSFPLIDDNLIDNEHIITLPRRVATRLAYKGDFVIKPLPMNVPSFNYYMFWHRRFNQDERNKWIREKIYSLLAD